MLFRSDYAVMNLDFMRAQTSGAEPNLRVVSSVGFDSFTVPAGAATITDLVFSDGDLDSQNDWVASVGRSGVTWTAPNAASALNWGTMFRFSFIVGQAPVKGTAMLRVGAAGDPKVLKATNLLAPGSPCHWPRGNRAVEPTRRAPHKTQPRSEPWTG